MSRPSRFVVPTVLALLAGVLAVAVGASPAQAAVVRPFTLNYNAAVHGDVVSVGNTSTACPTVGSPADPFGEPIATCAQTQARTNTTSTGINDSYYMRWADVDASAATYNSSTASVTIPAGATVAFARLSWSGDTGTIRLADGTVSALPGCNTRQFLAGGGTSVLPAGTPESTSVRITVGGAATAAVAPQVISRDALANVPASQPQFYSAYADVTSRFAGVATGSPVTVTLGNVWTPQGFGCYAGWNLHVVYDDPTDDLPLRQVQVVDGHVRQSSIDPATTVTFSGFRSIGPARVGVAAYEGDYNIAGDRIEINGTSVAEPLSSGTTTNFFVSNAEGSASPSTANNMSVDAVTVDTTAVPNGATSAQVTFATAGDTFLATTAVLSVPIAELKLRAATTAPGPFRSGQPVEFEVGLSAVGSDVTDVEVEVPGLTDCTRAVPDLAAGGTESTYTCTGTAPTDDATYDFAVSGIDSAVATLTAEVSVPLDVLTPGLEITATPDQAGYATDETISLDVSVENVGDSNVSDLALSTTSGTCGPLSASSVASAGTVTATCTATAPVADDSVTIEVTGEDVLGGDVDDSVEVDVPAVGTVSGSVFVDRDRDGVLDAGESGPAGVTITLTGTDAVGQPVNRTTTTGAGGDYEFTAVRAGSYSLTQTQPSAYDDGEDTPGTHATSAGDDTFDVVLTSGQSSTGNLFAELPRPVAVGSVTASPTTIVAGASTTLSAEGEDSGGGYAGDVTAGTTFATETPGGSCTGSTCTSTQEGSLVVTSSYDGTPGPTTTVTVVAGPAGGLEATSGGGQIATAGDDFADPLVVTVTDEHDNPVSGVEVEFTLPATDGSATFAGGGTTRSVTTGANGRATSPLVRAARAGAVEATAVVDGLGSESFELTVVAGDAAQVDAVSGGGQTAAAGKDFADRLVASVSDALDNPVSGADVVFTLPASAGSATFVGGGTTRTVATGTDGRASSPVVRGVRAGVVEATATVDGAGGATYELTVTAGSPATVSAVSGTGQTVNAGEAFAAPLVASVADESGSPVSGVSVEFTLPNSDGTATFAGGGTTATVLTGAGGRATSPALTGGRAGALVATARVAGVGEAATYALTVVAVVGRSADLGVRLKVITPDWAKPGKAARLAVVATNNGNVTATRATLTLNLPRGWVVRNSHDLAKRDGRRWTRTVEIPAGESARFFVTVGFGSPKARKVTASVRSSVADPSPGDNSVRLRLRPRSLR